MQSLRASAAALTVAGIALMPYAASAESRSYVVSSFTLASYSQDGDCSKGINASVDDQNDKNLLELGVSKEELAKLSEDGAGQGKKFGMLVFRGKANGKTVSSWINPASAPDPKLNAVDGKYAFGFNLDGCGAESPNGFEHPFTKEKGVNNQLFRAMGCFTVFRGDDKIKPTAWLSAWDIIRPGMLAWLMTLDGADLSKNGEIKIVFDRALEHVERDAKSEVLRDMTFRLDPNPRSHIELKGKITNGQIELTEHGELRAAFGEEMLFPELLLKNTHLRLTIQKDGSLQGHLGGYQPWKDTYSSSWYANGGSDQVGLYYLLRAAADANPDPKTGMNRDISTAYTIEAVPAFTVPLNKNKVAAR